MGPRLPTATLLALTQALVAQGPAVVGLVRSPEGRPLAQVEALLQPDPEPLRHLEGWLPMPPVVTAVGDDAGKVKVPAAGPGTLLLRHASGLGTVIPWAAPGAPFRTALQPMAALVAGDGGQLQVHAAVFDPRFGRRRLPILTGAEVRLPAGAYELWLGTGDTWSWLRTQLAPGERRTVAPPAAELRSLALGPGMTARVFPRGWAGVELLTPETPRCGLHAAVPTFLVLATDDGRLRSSVLPTAEGNWQADPGEGAGSPTRIQTRPGAEVWFLAEPGLVPVARARADGDGNAMLPLPDGARGALLGRAEGCAPVAVDLADLGALGALPLGPGRALRLRCTDPGGAAAHVLLELAAASAPAAALLVRTDQRGEAALPHAPDAAATLLVGDDRYANASIAVPAELAEVQIRLDPGASLSGRVMLPDGAPATGAAVFLRDPTGRLRPAERAATTGSDGAFRFRGLPEQGAFVLFAQQIRGGRTWSARMSQVAPEGAELVLHLKSEDPALPGTGR